MFVAIIKPKFKKYNYFSICIYVVCTTSKYPCFLEKLFLFYYVDMETTYGIVPTIIIHFYWKKYSI